jgi:hypothetical protein
VKNARKKASFSRDLGHLNEDVYVLDNEVILFVASSFCDENRFAICGDCLGEAGVRNVG